MSISIVSNVAANISSAAPAAALGPIDALPLNFAALLSAQTLGADQSRSLEAPLGSTEKSGSSDLSSDTMEKSNSETLDPSIFASLFGLQQLPAANAQIQKTGKLESEEQDKEACLDVISNPTKQQPPSTNTHLSASDNEPAGNAISFLESQRQASSPMPEAANIAADTATSATGASSFGLAMSNALSSHDTHTSKQASVSAPLNSSTWPTQFSEKIVWLAKNDQQTAQININPPQLGPVQITLNLNGDQANAVFASPHAEVRHAIETAMPQLREMLSSAGINLGDANVGANLSQQSQQPPSQLANKAQPVDENAILPASANVASSGNAQIVHRGRGLVDLFA